MRREGRSGGLERAFGRQADLPAEPDVQQHFGPHAVGLPRGGDLLHVSLVRRLRQTVGFLHGILGEVISRKLIHDAGTTMQDAFRKEGADAGKALEPGEGIVDRKGTQRIAVEQAIEGGPGNAVEAVDLLRAEAVERRERQDAIGAEGMRDRPGR